MKNKNYFLKKSWNLLKNNPKEKLLLTYVLLSFACSAPSTSSVHSSSNLSSNYHLNEPTSSLQNLFGMKNFGNNCYINSVLALLWKAYSLTGDLSTLLKEKEKTQEVNPYDLKQQLSYLFATMPETFDGKTTPQTNPKETSWNKKHQLRNEENGPLKNIVEIIQNTNENGEPNDQPNTKEDDVSTTLLKLFLYPVTQPDTQNDKRKELGLFDTFGYFYHKKENLYYDHEGETPVHHKMKSLYIKENSENFEIDQKPPKIIFMKPLGLHTTEENIEMTFTEKSQEKKYNYTLQGFAYRKLRESEEVNFTTLKNNLQKLTTNSIRESFDTVIDYFEKEDPTAKKDIIAKLNSLCTTLLQSIVDKEEDRSVSFITIVTDCLKKKIEGESNLEEQINLLTIDHTDDSLIQEIKKSLHQLILPPAQTTTQHYGHWSTYLKAEKNWIHHDDNSLSTKTKNEAIAALKQQDTLLLYVLEETNP